MISISRLIYTQHLFLLSGCLTFLIFTSFHIYMVMFARLHKYQIKDVTLESVMSCPASRQQICLWNWVASVLQFTVMHLKMIQTNLHFRCFPELIGYRSYSFLLGRPLLSCAVIYQWYFIFCYTNTHCSYKISTCLRLFNVCEVVSFYESY